MSSNEITVPDVLKERAGAFKRIHENNEKVFGHVEYLRDLVTSMHQMYHQLCRKLMQVSDDCERRIGGSGKIKTEHSQVVMEFVKSISFLHFSISNQLNSNTVTLGTKTHRIAKNRLNILKERLFTCSELNEDYVKSVEEFNKKERSFTEKCLYFSDYEKDIFKFYSLKANVQLHDKLQGKEIKLKQTQEELFHKKQDYLTNVHQLRAGIKDYFQLEQNIISEYSRLLLNIRKINNRDNALLYAQPIMQEPSDEMNTTTNHVQHPLTHRSERPSEKSVGQERKEIIREQERIVTLQQIFNDLLSEIQQSINKAGEHIDEMRSTKQYNRFVKDKIAMSEILPVDSLREIDLIVNEIVVFRKTIINIINHLGKVKVLNQISKYRSLNYQKYLEQTANFVEMEKKGLLSPLARAEYHQIQAKFRQRNNEYMSRCHQRIVELQKAIREQYYREEKVYTQNKPKKINQNSIFEKPYYQVLLDPFFLNRNTIFVYTENPYLKKQSLYISANQIQNTMTLQTFSKPKKKKQMRSCCGLFSGESEEEKPPVIDDYFCALKDGYVLIQGTLTLYENYFSFTSSFNPKTLFGFTDIRIPKWDILQILKDRHLLNRKIVVETTHGNIEFTSFFDDPNSCYDQLVRLYQTEKNNGTSTLHKHSIGDTELAGLQTRIQSQLQPELLKVNIVVDKLCTYLSEDRLKLSVSIEYHPNGTSSHSLFEIKFIQSESNTSMNFIHDALCKDSNIKQLLQGAIKQLFYRKEPFPQGPLIQVRGADDRLECSIIQGVENNKLSFRKEPSFINGKGENNGDVNLEEIRMSQLSFGPLLNSTKNFLQTSRNADDYESRMSPTIVNRISSESDRVVERILLTTPRTSAEYEKEELTEEKLPQSAIVMPVEEAKSSASQSKQSRKSQNRKMNSRSGSKPQDQANYKAIFIVVLAVFILNMILNLVSG